MSRYCPKPLYKILKPATELLAGIPSIVYGFFRTCGTCSVRKNGFRRKRKQYAYSLDFAWNNDLPTIIGVSESAIRSVPESYYEGA